MSEPVAWTLAREGGELVYAVSSREAAEAWAANTNYRAAPIYTADAIREAVEAEREACASLIEPKNPRSDWTEYAEAKADCAAMIRARGAA